MNWLFWLLLALGILLLLAPLLLTVGALAATLIWLIGGVLLIGAAIWVVIALARSGESVAENP